MMPLQAGFGALFAGFYLVFIILALVLLAVMLMPAYFAYKAGRSGWWIYLICAFIGPLNIAALIAWFAHFKDHPTKLGNTDLVI